MSKTPSRKPYHAESYALPLGFNGALAGPYRWFSGRPLNGHRYTDATGFRYGTMATDLSGRATAYQLLPGYKRFLYARFPIMVAPAAAVAFAVEPHQTTLAGVGLATLGARELDKWRRTRKYRRQVVEPVAAGLSAVMRQKHVDGRGYLWLNVPPDFRDVDGAKITAQLPTSWVGEDGDKKRMTDVVAARLNLSEATPSWTWKDGQHTVSWSVPPKPPKLVAFADGLALLDGLDAEAVSLGAGPRGARVSMSLKGDSPHAILAAGSGAGKSELLAYIVGQFMRRGSGILVCDAKFISHMWLRSVPGVAYASEPEELHNAIMWLDSEVDRRARFVAKGGDPSTLEPLAAVLEEMSSARNRLDTYWKSIRVTGQPALSPALSALANVANMGREVRVHVFMAGQSITAKVTGGPEGRESYSARMLARATSNQWRMLAPQIKPAPTARQAPGRWHIVVGDTLTEFQAPYMDLKGETCGGPANATARLIEWATGGLDRVDVAALIEAWVQDHEFLEGGGGGTEDGTNAQAGADAPPVRGISIREFAETSGVELRTLNRWRERRSDFPTWVAIGGRNTHLFDPGHLKAYVSERLREPVEIE